MKKRTTFIPSLTAVLILIAGNAFGKYSGGKGEPNDPYQIADINDLLLLAADANDYAKSFILTADVNMGGQVFTTAIIAPDTESYPGFQGTKFTGAFDGNGYVISNLTISAPTKDYVGLFGYVDNFGQVKNLGVVDANINARNYLGGLVGANGDESNSGGTITSCYASGSVSGEDRIGGLVGINYRRIESCYATGSVTGTVQAGGLVGQNCGYDGDGLLTSCYATGSVTGWWAGGLVGYNSHGMLTSCYATGSVTGTNCVGGLVGLNNYGIICCYATGSATGTGQDSDFVGGLVGQHSGSGFLMFCYATGSVTGGANGTGGLVGGGWEVVYLDACFWDIQTSGTSDGVGYVEPDPAGAIGKTTAEMKKLSTFISAGWDFVEAWGIGNGQTYPYLKPFNGINPADIDYSGTVDFFDFAIMANNWLSGVE